MAHVHDHGHDHGRRTSGRRLTITLLLVAGYMVAEVIGGILSGSLALLADAGHMLSDAAALALALLAIRIARKPPTARRTFGYHRAEILAALANGATLVVVAVLIVIEAWERLRAPSGVEGGLMMAVAGGGLVVNLAGLALLHGGRDDSLNMRGAWLHVLGDALGSVQAMVAGLLIWRFGWLWVDPVASVLIAGLIGWSAWSLLRASVDVLMESAPPHLDLAAVHSAMAEIEGVEDVHDLHVWTITSGREALSAHVCTDAPEPARMLDTIRRALHEAFGIDHVTIQLEPSLANGGEGCCACPWTAAAP